MTVQEIKRRTSFLRLFISYMILGIVSLIPLSFYIISPHIGLWDSQINIITIPLGRIMIEINFSGRMMPVVMSTMIGVSGGFILWCYYSRGKCTRYQKPNVLQVYSS